MKIAIINLDNGGIMHYAVDLANSLVNKIEIHFIGYHESKQFLDQKCKTSYIEKRDIKNFINNVRKIGRNSEIEIIHLSGYHIFYLPIVFILKFYKKKIIYTLHDVDSHPSYNNSKKFIANIKEKLVYGTLLRKYLASKADHIITLSNYVNNLAQEKFKINTTVIPLSQNIERYKNIKSNNIFLKNNKFKILFFGIIDRYKGLENLISAVEVLSETNHEFELIIAGKNKGDMINIPNGIKDKIIWYDRFIEEYEVENLFKNADVVVLPYTEVSQSGVISMALAYHKAIISTNIGSFSEYVFNNVNGFLVNPGSPNQISDKLEYLIQNPQKKEEFENQSRLFYEKYLNWHVLSDQYLDIYNEILK